MPFLSIDNLKVSVEKSRPGVRTSILDNLSLHVEAGELLVILGASGSGKTTFLRSIAGLVSIDDGSLLLNGKDITKLQPHDRKVAFVFQNGGWYDHLTVKQNLRLNLDAFSVWPCFGERGEGQRLAIVEDWLERFQLTDCSHQYPSQLSGGQAQRLAIGRAMQRLLPLSPRGDLSESPREERSNNWNLQSLMLLDEPFSQLDESLRCELREFLRELHQQGQTMIYVTHDQYDAMQLATHIAILHQGKIQQIDSPENLYRQPNHRIVAESLGQPPMQFIEWTDIDTQDQALLKSQLLNINFDIHQVSLGIRPEGWECFEEPRKDHLSLPVVFDSCCCLGASILERWRYTKKDGSTNILLRLNQSREPAKYTENHSRFLTASVQDIFGFDSYDGERVF